jgi:uncharacterized protein (DUF2336 family)
VFIVSDNIVIPPDSAGPKGPAVRFGGLQADRLYELARRKDAQSRVELGNTVTSLFVESDLSLREQEIISDILITMLKQAERDLRRSIADRLAALDKAPLRVVLHLANDEIEVAEKILAQSPVLEEMDLVLIIETQPSPYWQAIAERQDLRESVVRSLVQTRDYPTASVLVKNQNAIIPLDSFEVLVDMSNTANDLCVPLLGRRDLPPQMIADLYAIAATKIGQDVMMSLPPERRAEIEPHLADVAREYVQATKGNTDPTEMMIEAARSMKKKGRLTIEGMIQSLNNGQLASFMAQMMVFLEAGLPAIKDMLADASAQMMIALCRVNRVEKKMFLKMFLLSHKYRTGERVV